MEVVEVVVAAVDGVSEKAISFSYFSNFGPAAAAAGGRAGL